METLLPILRAEFSKVGIDICEPFRVRNPIEFGVTFSVSPIPLILISSTELSSPNEEADVSELEISCF